MTSHSLLLTGHRPPETACHQFTAQRDHRAPSSSRRPRLPEGKWEQALVTSALGRQEMERKGESVNQFF